MVEYAFRALFAPTGRLAAGCLPSEKAGSDCKTDTYTSFHQAIAALDSVSDGA
jgi:hypothetical protein